MKLMTMTVKLGFKDDRLVSLDDVKEVLTCALSHSMEADAFYLDDENEWHVSEPDPQVVDDPHATPLEDWCERAVEELERGAPHDR